MCLGSWFGVPVKGLNTYIRGLGFRVPYLSILGEVEILAKPEERSELHRVYLLLGEAAGLPWPLFIIFWCEFCGLSTNYLRWTRMPMIRRVFGNPIDRKHETFVGSAWQTESSWCRGVQLCVEFRLIA